MKPISLTGFALCLTLSLAAQDRQEFRNPSAHYRPKPLWFWNDTRITREGITFVVTNTKKTDRTDTPDTPVKPSNPSKPSSPAKPTLPQTGAVWWHVEALALSGLVFLILGALDRKTEA